MRGRVSRREVGRVVEGEDLVMGGAAEGVVRRVAFQDRRGGWVLVVDGELGELLGKLAPDAVLDQGDGATHIRYTRALHRLLSELIDALAVIRWSAPTMRQLRMFEGGDDGQGCAA